MISVLYVDDELGFLELTRSFLELQGDMLVDAAPSALEAIEMLKRHNYDAVVSDYQMPIMDGLKFLAYVRNRHGQMPFILFTGKGREEVVIQALNGGADFYLQKGGDAKAQFAELAHKIRQAVERKKRSDALSLAEFSVDHSAVITLWTDEQGRILKSNREAARQLGFSKEQICGMRLKDIDPNFTDEVLLQFWKELESRRQVTMESIMRRRDGTMIPVQFTANFLEMGGRKYNFAFGWDISESKRANQALRESEESFRTVVERANSIILKVDLEGTITYANDFALRFFGYQAHELIGRPVIGTIVPPVDSEGRDMEAAVKDILAATERHGTNENENVRKDGSRAWVAWTNKALRDERGQVTEVLSIGMDITPLKNEENGLRLDQARLLQAQRLGRMGDFHYLLGPDHSVVNATWSEEVYRSLSLPPDQPPLGLEEIKCRVHPHDRVAWQEAVDRAFLTGELVRMEHRNLLNGENRHVLVAFQATPGADGGWRFSGTVQDITELKKVEEALRESEQRYRTLADLIPDQMMVLDPGGRVRYVNSPLAEELGVEPSALVGRRLEELVSEELALRQRHDLELVLRSGESLRVEVQREDGQADKWLDTYLVPVKGAEGQVVEVISASRDITSRKRAEAQLWDSMSLYRALAENLPGIVYRIHLREDEKVRFFNQMLQPITGYPPDELEPDYPSHLRKLLEPEDRALLLATVREAVERDRPFEMEYRMRRKDGRVIHVMERGRPSRGADGLPLFVDGVIFDITDRKVAEGAIRESERKFRELADMLPALVFETDLDGRLTFINEAAQATVGRGREDLEAGLQLSDLLEAHEHERMRERMAEVVKGEACAGEIFMVRRQDGTSFPATTHCLALRGQGGVEGVRGLFVDVSDLVESEKIQESTHRIARAALSYETLDELYLSIHQILRELMPLDNFFIALYDEDLDELSFPYFVDRNDPRPETRHRGKGITEYVLRTGEPLLTTGEGIERLRQAGELEIIGSPPVDFMAVPLTVEGRTIGLMAAQSYDPKVRFGPKSLEVMRFVSSQVAMAIRHKRHEVDLRRYVGLLRTTFESTDDGILIVDLEGKVLAANDRFSKMWCIPDSIMRTQDDHRLLEFVLDQLKDPQGFLGRVRQMYADPQLTSIDRVEFKDGRYFDRYSQPFRIEDRVAGRIWSFRDVSERAQAEEALHKSESELKSIVNSAKDAIFVKAPDGEYVMVNEAMGALFKTPVAEILGLTDADLFGPEVAEANARADQEVLAGRTVEEEVSWPISDSPHTFSVIKVPLRDDRDRVVGVCGIARDTTERKLVEKALKDANESLNLLSSITRHDVLNQLMVIRGYSDLVRASLKDQKLMDYMDKVERSTRNIRSQILFTRDFQRLGVGEPKWQSVEELLDKALTNLEIGKLDVSVDLAGLELLADPMLEKVFYNYLDNTVRHGEKATRISVTCRRQGNGLLVIYEDDGMGIKAEDKGRIFDRGFGKNTGLGLFLVRLILKVTAIQVRETGEYGQGVRFEMLVPDGTYRFREWDDSER